MHRGPRTIRLAKWAGVVLCVLIIATWAVSMFVAVGIAGAPRASVVVESGVFIALWSAAPAAGLEWFISPAEPRRLSPLFEWFPSEVSAMFIPCWLPLALLIIPTALLLWLDRRRIRRGHCWKCGYNLRGNVSGRCPECGRKTSDRFYRHL